jgi:hypothetical protein
MIDIGNVAVLGIFIALVTAIGIATWDSHRVWWAREQRLARFRRRR